MADHARSADALKYRRWYGTNTWRRLRVAQLARQPLCEKCLPDRVTAAEVVNHKRPHKGSWALFTDPANHQSVCKPHHDGEIQRAERIGFSTAVDDRGFPTDPKHPAYRSPDRRVRRAIGRLPTIH